MQTFIARGGLWVIGQFALLAAAGALAAATRGSLAPLAGGPGLVVGALLMLIAVVVGLKSARDLGRALTALPEPLRDATLVQSGIYGVVRHPIYLAVVLLTLGWALVCASWPALISTGAVVVYFNAKAGVEERMLSQKYPEYASYRARVGKLFPKLMR